MGVSSGFSSGVLERLGEPWVTTREPLPPEEGVANDDTAGGLGLGFFIIPALLGSSKEIMISALIQQQISVFLMWGQGTALGMFLLICTILILVIVSKLNKGQSLFPGVDKK